MLAPIPYNLYQRCLISLALSVLSKDGSHYQDQVSNETTFTSTREFWELYEMFHQ